MGKRRQMPSYKTIEDYINAQKPEAQRILKELRSIIKKTVPTVIELENKKAAVFALVPDAKRDQQIMISAYKNFVSFYPFPETVEHFEDELQEYKLGKGAIQFPFDAKIPKNLIERMVKHKM